MNIQTPEIKTIWPDILARDCRAWHCLSPGCKSPGTGLTLAPAPEALAPSGCFWSAPASSESITWGDTLPPLSWCRCLMNSDQNFRIWCFKFLRDLLGLMLGHTDTNLIISMSMNDASFTYIPTWIFSPYTLLLLVEMLLLCVWENTSFRRIRRQNTACKEITSWDLGSLLRDFEFEIWA